MSLKRWFIIFIFCFIACGCAQHSGHRGKASWYGGRFHGRTTASGEAFNQNALTAAHKKLPFGTRVKVVNKNNGQSVVVRINDRGPYKRGRIIDLSRAAAQKIGMLEKGVIRVEIFILSTPQRKRRKK